MNYRVSLPYTIVRVDIENQMLELKIVNDEKTKIWLPLPQIDIADYDGNVYAVNCVLSLKTSEGTVELIATEQKKWVNKSE